MSVCHCACVWGGLSVWMSNCLYVCCLCLSMCFGVCLCISRWVCFCVCLDVWKCLCDHLFGGICLYRGACFCVCEKEKLSQIPYRPVLVPFPFCNLTGFLEDKRTERTLFKEYREFPRKIRQIKIFITKIKQKAINKQGWKDFVGVS
jgi:hypothetical protein